LWIRIRINLSCCIRIQEGKNDLQIKKKVTNFHVLKCWMFFFEAESFSCSLCDHYGGLGISKLQFFIKKISNFYLAINFFPVFGRQNPGFGTGSRSAIRKNAGSGSALSQCGSTTLNRRNASNYWQQQGCLQR
jgi:hypothetical protein